MYNQLKYYIYRSISFETNFENNFEIYSTTLINLAYNLCENLPNDHVIIFFPQNSAAATK